MTSSYIKRLFIVLFFVVFFSKAFASHMAGGTIEYQIKSNDSIRITLKLYRDCNGSPLSNLAQVTIKSMSCPSISPKSIYITKKSYSPINFMCNGQQSVCTGGSFPYGIEEHIYDTTLRVDSAFMKASLNACCWLRIYFQECCRNANVTNVNVGSFYIDAEVNRCLINTAPKFKNLPVAVLCSGQGVWYNNGASDSTDHDSIVTEMAKPLAGENLGVGFTNSFDSLKPLTFLGFPNASLAFPAGFNLNIFSGDLGFTPMGQQQPALAFKISEWRIVNGTYQKISCIRRDVQFYTYSCPPNNPPELEINGSKSGPWIFTVCALVPSCVTLRARDKDSTSLNSDTTGIYLLSNPVNGSFYSANAATKTLREDSAVFCWTPSLQQVSTLPYYIGVKATDDNCPVLGASTRVIGFRVGTNQIQGYIKRTILSDFDRQFQFVRTDTGTTGSYQWTVSGMNNGQFSLSGATTYTTPVCTHTFTQNGTYVVRLTFTLSACTITKWDTVTICQLALGYKSNDTAACYRLATSITCVPQNTNGTLWYKWRKNEGSNSITLADTTAVINVADTNNNSNYVKRVLTYRVLVYNSSECTLSDSIKITLNKQIALQPVTSPINICNNNSMATLQVSPVINDSAIKYYWSNGKTTRQIIEKDSGKYIIKVWNPDSTCFASDSITLNVKPVPDANLGPDQYNCAGKLITLAGVSGATNIWYRNSLTLATPNVAPTVTTTYRLQSYFTYGSLVCTDWDTMVVIVGNKATVTINPPGYKCNYDNSVPLTLTQTSLPAGTGVWSSSSNGCISSNIFNAACAGTGIHKVYYTFTTDTFNCVSKDSTTINVGAPAAITLTHAPNYCLSQGTASFTALPQSGGNGYWYSPSGNCFSGNVFYLSCAGPGTHKYFYTFYTLPHGCMSQDSATFTIVGNPLSMFSANPLSGTAPLTIYFYDNSSGQPGTYEWLFSNPFVGFNYSSFVQNPVYTFVNAGVYNVRLTTRKTQAGITCSDSLTAPAFISVNPNTSGIKANEGVPESVHIFPNPSHENFTVQCNRPGKYLVELFDYTGKMTLQEIFTGTESTLNISELAKGIYLAVITTENNERTIIKLMKE
ncbi:MAG: T9SS type A sorting domain-containing protein [Bacteroidia bacterium]|nr:T9SS type A sorting domain-containing protein [Bacteroidia bacterium]